MCWKAIIKSRVLRQYIAGLTCSLTIGMQSSSVNWPSPAIPNLQGERPDVNLTDDEITWMVSTLFLGKLVSSIPTGYLMDKFGRKKSLLYATTFNIISWVILYFATSPYQFYVARFLCGLSNGVNSVIAPIYICEISEKDVRGSITNTMNILGNMGAVYTYTIGMYVSYQGLVIATSVIPIVFILTFIWMPETPYYYLIKNESDKAVKSLTWFRCDQSIDTVIDELKFIDFNIKKQLEMKSSYREVVSTRANRKGILIVLIIAGLNRLTGFVALAAYLTDILPKNSLTFLSFDQCIILLGVLRLVSPILTSLFIDKCNRRPLLLVSCFGCGLANLAAAAWFFGDIKTEYKHITDNYAWVPLVSFISLSAFFAVGLGPTAFSIRGELFAANIKGQASALATAFFTITAFITSKFFLNITDDFGMYLNFAVYSISCFVGLILIHFYVIETKGKTLEEIQDELNNERNRYRILESSSS